jgi:GcrA cell cycle regulator
MSCEQRHIKLWEQTDGLTDRLISLHNSGLHGFGEIARMLSVEFQLSLTRNAVIGKAHRIGLPLKAPPRPKKRKLLPEPLPLPQVRFNRARLEYFIPVMPAAPTLAPRPGLEMYELSDTTCRYPLGDGPPPFLYCGRPCCEDCIYCPEHCELTHRNNREST